MAGILEEFLLVFKPTVRGSGFQTLNKQLKETHNNLFSVKNLFRAFIGYDIYTGLKTFATGLIDSSKELGAMTSRFYAITKSNKLANKELEWTFNLAKRTAMPLKATADSYSIFYSAVQKSIGTQGARDVFKSWTEVSRVLHLSTYQFERVTYALREMASKGAIYSQDLRMQIGTHVPNAMGLAKKASEELGITGSNWFETLQKKAKGNQELISKFVLLFSKYAKEMYASPEALAEALKKPDAQLQMLYNSWKEFQYGIVKAGFEKDLIGILQSLNIFLRALAVHADDIYKITKALLKLFLYLSSLKLIKFLISSRFARSLITTFNYHKKSLGVLKAMSKVLKGASFLAFMNIFKGTGLAKLAWLLTTPTGWVLIGLTAIIAGVFWFKKTFPNAWLAMTNILQLLRDKIEKLIQWFSKHFGESNKDTSKKTITEKWNDLSAKGGFYANSTPEADKMYRALMLAKIATKNVNNTPLDAIVHKIQKMTPSQQNFNIEISNAIQSGASAEEITAIITEKNPALISRTINGFKNAFKKN